jgi:hypothetical protein
MATPVGEGLIKGEELPALELPPDNVEASKAFVSCEAGGGGFAMTGASS